MPKAVQPATDIQLTVGALRRQIEDVPDDHVILVDIGSSGWIDGHEVRLAARTVHSVSGVETEYADNIVLLEL